MRPSGDDDIDLMISRIYYDERCPQQFHSCRPPSVALKEESYRTNLEPEYCYLVQRLFAARCKHALRLGNDALDSIVFGFPRSTVAPRVARAIRTTCQYLPSPAKTTRTMYDTKRLFPSYKIPIFEDVLNRIFIGSLISTPAPSQTKSGSCPIESF